MVRTKPYEAVIPVPKDKDTANDLALRGIELGQNWPVDDKLIEWCIAESWHHDTQAWGLEIVDFKNEGTVPVDWVKKHHPDLIKFCDEVLDNPPEDFVFHRFTGSAKRAAYVDEAIAKAQEDRRTETLADAEAEAEAGNHA